MSAPVTTTTEQDDVLLRFLAAANARLKNHPGRVPCDGNVGKLVITWLRGLVGKLNEDGSTGTAQPVSDHQNAGVPNPKG